ncbi:aldehyde dehydrogenase (NADP(+)) [Neokomagataea tanensis]|uniref:Aldehyde dehydrogenase (NADP(+)) n=2 Tax=Neokomagataea TaxID=1223423 RepID=A0A4Y6V3C3_9PROT|nr:MULTISPECIES: aldehyde dehydrogenase (NADP(+)) [Neokomagataea]QDH24559.1 aldehyde dehydrogenase (NADP(+)) [Neokomagataea tanensis]
MLTGDLIIGSSFVKRERTFAAENPATGEALDTSFSCATEEDVRLACELAGKAYQTFRNLKPNVRAEFLEQIALEIEACGDALIERTCAETALPPARITGERGRTTGQLRMFAEVLRKGEFQQAKFDRALPDRAPLPRPDMRQVRIAVGPVAVFGASNFPLAFSVAGGDTASALAAGCPVVVRAHPAHPGCSEMVGRAIQRAVQHCGLPEGVFSLLGGTGHEIGAALVKNPEIAAVGFTGSRAGGLALSEIASNRPVPIPVYAEMSSINPVYLFPQALKNSAEELGKGFAASLTMGAGQFCTNPGLILGVAGPDLELFIKSAAKELKNIAATTMLTSGIYANYSAGVAELIENDKVSLVARGPEGGLNACQSALFATDAHSFMADKSLSHEVFGASSLVVECDDMATLRKLSAGLEGQLTATLHLREGDIEDARTLLPILELKAGRILANSWPTGVEVCETMVHGGPFPATSDVRTTSVGTGAIERFLRPVCYQNMPTDLLPSALVI